MGLVILDSGPLGLLTDPRRRSKSDRYRQWLNDLVAAEVRVLVSESPTMVPRPVPHHPKANSGPWPCLVVVVPSSYASSIRRSSPLAAAFAN